MLLSNTQTSITDSTFECFSLSGANGGLISAEFVSTEQLTITDSSFTSISADNGGVMYVTMSSESSVQFTASAFTSCRATGTSGNGGAAYVDLGTSGKLLFNPDHTSESSGTPTSFDACTASNGAGGGIYLVSAGTDTEFVIKNTNFDEDSCTAQDSYGGSVFVSCTDASPLTGNLFDASKGTLLLDAITVQPAVAGQITVEKPLLSITATAVLTISGCAFENITRSADTTASGGAVVNAGLTGEQTLSVSSNSSFPTSFTRCHSESGNGGALYISLGSSAHLIFGSEDSSLITFTQCTASAGFGGGVYVDSTATLNDDSLRALDSLIIRQVSFEECDCSAGDDGVHNGAYFYFSCPNGFDFLIRPYWRGTIDKYDEDLLTQFWVQETTSDNTEDSVLNYLFPPHGTTAYIGTTDVGENANNGTDVDGCGETPDTACLTIAFAFTNVRASHFILLTGTHTPEESNVTFTERLVYAIESESESELITQPVSNVVSASALFSLTAQAEGEDSNPYLGIIRLSFSVSAGVECPVIHASGGSLHLCFIHFHPATGSSVVIAMPLIVVNETGAASLDSCTIEGFSLSGENEAPVVCAYLGEGQRLTLNGTEENPTSTTSCSATDGKSGAIYIQLSSDSDVVEVSYVKFSYCKYGSGSTVRNIYIDSYDASKVIPTADADTELKWTYFFTQYNTTIESSKDAFIVEESISTDTHKPQTASILHFLYAPSSNAGLSSVYTSVSGADLSTCGWADLPCLTINYALASKHEDTQTVTLCPGDHIAESVAISSLPLSL